MEPSIIDLLKDPRMSEAEFLLLQSGKPPYAVKNKKGKPLSDLVVAAGQIGKIFQEIIPESLKAALVNQPSASCRVLFAGFGMVELTVIKTSAATQVLLKPLSEAAPVEEAPSVTASQAANITPSAPEIERYFAIQLAMKASDMHLSSGVVPMVRKDGEMMPMEGMTAPLAATDLQRILVEMMPAKNREEFETRHDTDFAYE